MGGDPLLRLLDTVAWRGQPVPGERPQQLLAALAAAEGRPVGVGELVSAVWDLDEPANPHKAVQVLVSRVRAQTGRAQTGRAQKGPAQKGRDQTGRDQTSSDQTGPEVVVRVGGGYRLALREPEVDAWAGAAAMRSARAAETAGDLVGARGSAEALLAGPEPAASGGGGGGDGGGGALARLREAARERRRHAGLLLGRAASGLGDHEVAVGHLERLADAGVPLDEPTLAALLRSESVVRGAPAALRRFERARAQLRDRLGVAPGPALQAAYAELLLADQPLRTGLRFGATSLVGREEDLAALRASLATSRVTTIVGPGGMGKTRLAQVLAQESTLPVVHVVELVAAATADDVVAEIASALGVRGSVTGRTLTADQRTDLRTRIARHLSQAPTLLVLDNCEHVVEAVAPLVAVLVGSAPALRVLATSRARLAITAERVHGLGQLTSSAAVELFCQRADAARPGAVLEPADVRRVVDRLDGLPLAIELAAAKVRVMAVPQIAALLSDRFALLTGEDRSAPDRHQTLLAVIDWSWNLLEPAERAALGVLSVLADGFTFDTADALLSGAAQARPPGPTQAPDLVRGLVDQSLLGVDEAAGSVRFRMLETVREFGQRKLDQSGEAEAARATLRRWARSQADELADVVDRGVQIIVPDRTTMGEWAHWAATVTRATVVDIATPRISLDPLRMYGPHVGSRITQSFLTPLLAVSPTSERGVLLADVLDSEYLSTHRLTGLGDLLAHLEDGCRLDGAYELARLMRVFARRDLGRVIFDHNLPPLTPDAPAIVIRTHTLELPNREELHTAHLFEQMRLEKIFGRATYALIAGLARQVCFADRTRLGMFPVDEAHHLTSSPEGEREIIDFVRDGRKHSAAVILGSHDPEADFGTDTLRGLIPTRIQMRQRDKTLARKGLRWLDMDPDDDDLLEMLVTQTSPVGPHGVPEHRRGEAFIRDSSGNIGRLKVLAPSLSERNQAVRTSPPGTTHGSTRSGSSRVTGTA